MQIQQELGHDSAGPESEQKIVASGARKWSLSSRSVLLLCASLGLLVTAIFLSQWSQTKTDPQFIELSVIPLPLGAGPGAEAARVEVHNVTRSNLDIVLRISQGSDILLTKLLPRFSSGQSWMMAIERNDAQRLTVTVSYGSDPTKVIRTVYLDAINS